MNGLSDHSREVKQEFGNAAGRGIHSDKQVPSRLSSHRAVPKNSALYPVLRCQHNVDDSARGVCSSQHLAVRSQSTSASWRPLKLLRFVSTDAVGIDCSRGWTGQLSRHQLDDKCMSAREIVRAKLVPVSGQFLAGRLNERHGEMWQLLGVGNLVVSCCLFRSE